ncbi:hypothetical protein NDU88_001231 [Pleurodeles waltl]|uniref:Uncharacterized protein n=1 Tax=Pleurodeles waltl TaxID=8319 RepID=A0AAV7NA62_PLEWA|nr:hypothetical protein NDU88_001231 [Pleurodeles waltl]
MHIKPRTAARVKIMTGDAPVPAPPLATVGDLGRTTNHKLPMPNIREQTFNCRRVTHAGSHVHVQQTGATQEQF